LIPAQLWQLLEERLQPCNELCVAREHVRFEIRKLEKHWTQFVVQDVNGIDELFELAVTIKQDFVMRNRSRNFQREDKARWGFHCPVIDGFNRRAPVESRIDLDGIEAR
jgi:hypothetical protein